MNDLTTFDSDTTHALRRRLVDAHARLAQIGIDGQRSITARNYDSAIKQLGAYMNKHGYNLPSRSVLESWRDTMLRQGYAVRTVNAKLSAARKLLYMVAADVTDIQAKLVLKDWAAVKDANLTRVANEDMTEADYGVRLTLGELQALIDSIDTTTIKGLRDRAIVALLAGAGLRVSEVVNLTLRDVFLTMNDSGQRAIKVRDGKHHKSRIVVVENWSSWVIEAVQAYAYALGKTPMEQPDHKIFEGVKRVQGGYETNGVILSNRGAQRVAESFTVQRGGETVTLAAHDLRRTYAKISKRAGMSWEALRANLGHASVKTTEAYVGHDVEWSERVPNWRVKLSS